MRGPPHGQEQCQQQPIQVRSIGKPTGFDVEAAAFAVLKGRFYPHAPSVFLHLSASGSLITDEQPCFLTAFVPDQTHIRFQGLLLPDLGFAIPTVTWLEDEVFKALPRR